MVVDENACIACLKFACFVMIITLEIQVEVMQMEIMLSIESRIIGLHILPLMVWVYLYSNFYRAMLRTARL